MKSNLDFFWLRKGELTDAQREMLPHCLIGSLSSFVAEDVWQRSVETAVRSAQVLRPESSEFKTQGE